MLEARRKVHLAELRACFALPEAPLQRVARTGSTLCVSVASNANDRQARLGSHPASMPDVCVVVVQTRVAHRRPTAAGETDGGTKALEPRDLALLGAKGQVRPGHKPSPHDHGRPRSSLRTWMGAMACTSLQPAGTFFFCAGASAWALVARTT
jgi:hypothetical protein